MKDCEHIRYLIYHNEFLAGLDSKQELFIYLGIDYI